MVEYLCKVFDRLANAGLKLKTKKCSLFCKSVEYLGHIISEKGFTTDPRKIGAIRDMSVPANVSELRSFLGICSYYRKFVKDFASIAKPLHKQTEKSKSFVWSEDCQSAFEKLKATLTSAPILAHPDFSKPFVLDTDASNFAMGAVLSQVHDGKERVIAYASNFYKV